jgi:putative hemolysin
MDFSRFVPVFMLVAALMLAGCANPVKPGGGVNNTTIPQGNGAGIPNPASVYCAQHNGTSEIRSGPEGQFGVCAFSDGAMCEEWAYQRGECSREKPNFCESDADCACGVHISTRDCFYGQKEFVDAGQQCPDFCNGIAAHLEIKCEKNQCTQVRKDAQQEK